MNKEAEPSPAEREHRLYFSLFKGREVFYTELFNESPTFMPAVDVLINRGFLEQKEVVVDDTDGGTTTDWIVRMKKHERDRKPF